LGYSEFKIIVIQFLILETNLDIILTSIFAHYHFKYALKVLKLQFLKRESLNVERIVEIVHIQVSKWKEQQYCLRV
jgi:hypothetical protein